MDLITALLVASPLVVVAITSIVVLVSMAINGDFEIITSRLQKITKRVPPAYWGDYKGEAREDENLSVALPRIINRPEYDDAKDYVWKETKPSAQPRLQDFSTPKIGR